MIRIRKQLLVYMLITALILSNLILIGTENTYADAYSGNAGENIYWDIDTESGVMSVTGNGDMTSYGQWQWTPYSVKYRDYVTRAIVQEGITSIGDNAFCCFEKLEEVTIPLTATSIGYYAFNNCFVIESISAPTITFIDNHAFYQCYALKNIELGENLSRINAYAFARCFSLESIYLPKSLSTIERYVFLECDSLTDVYYEGSEEDWKKTSIDYGNDNLLNANIHFNSTQSVIVPKVTHVNARNEDMYTMEKAVKYQMSNIMKDESLFNDTDVAMPALELGNYNIDLFKLTAKAEMKLSNYKWSAVIDNEKKTIKVKVGFEDDEKAGIVQTTDMCSSSWSNQYKEMKKFYKFVDGRNLNTRKEWNQFEKLKGQLNQMGCNLFLDAQMSIAGYLEFDYSSSEVKFAEGGILISAGLGAEYRFPLINLPVLKDMLYTSLGLRGDAEGNVVVKRNEVNALNTKIMVKPSITATAKVCGNIYLAKAEAGVDAEISATISNESDAPLTVDLSGKLFGSLSFPIINEKYDVSKNYLNYRMYPQSNTYNSLMSVDEEKIEDNLKSINRNYNLKSRGKNYEYPYNDAKLVSLTDGRILKIWIGDVVERNEENRTALMYSVLEDGKWSEDTVLTDDGKPVGAFFIAQDNDIIYIVYQQSGEIIENGEQTDEKLKKVDLFVKKFDGKRFSEALAITSSNNVCEVIQDVKVTIDGVEILWQENSENSLLGTEGINIIKSIKLKNNIISESEEHIRWDGNGTERIVESVLGNEKDIYYLKYNNNTNTYHIIREKDEKYIDLYTAKVLSNIKVSKDELFFIESNEIYTLKDETVSKTSISGVNSFKIAENKEEKYIFAEFNEGISGEIYISKFEDGKWSKLSQFSNFKQYIRSYYPIVGNANPMVIANCLEIQSENEDTEFEKSSILMSDEYEYMDLQLESVYVDENNLYTDNVLETTLEVYNHSKSDANNLKVIIEDLSTGVNIYSEVLDSMIKKEEKNTYTVKYKIPKEFTKRKVRIAIKSDEIDDDESNNSKEEIIGYTDLQISDVVLQNENNSLIASAELKNIGFDEACEVYVNIYEEGIKEKVSEVIKIENLKSGETKIINWALSDKLLKEPDKQALNALIFEVKTSSEEINLTNNDAKIAFDPNTTFEEKIEDPKYNLALQKNVIVYPGIEEGSKKYLNDGKLTKGGNHCAISSGWGYEKECYAVIDLGAYYKASTIDEIVIQYKDQSDNDTVLSRDYYIQYSTDGENYRTIVKKENVELSDFDEYNATHDEVSSIEGEVRYVKVYYPKSAYYGIQICEIAVLDNDNNIEQISVEIPKPESVEVYSNDCNSLIVELNDKKQEDFLYNIYIDDVKVKDKVSNGVYVFTEIDEGKHDVSVKAVRGEYMSEAKSINDVNVAGMYQYVSDTSNGIFPDKNEYGINYVRYTDVTASASSARENADARYAIDNDATTRWDSEFSDSQYIVVDMGQTYLIKNIGIRWEAANAKDFKVEVSTDGETYKTISYIKDAEGREGRLDDIILNNTIAARYVRIYGEKRNLEYGYSIWEMAIYGPSEEHTSDAYYDISIDGNKIASVSNGETISLGTSEYGYLCNGKIYNSSSNVEVEENMEFTSINKMDIHIMPGAGIKLTKPTGLRFKANLDTDNIKILTNSVAVTTGMLITTNDLFESNEGELMISSIYPKINIINNGWYNENLGEYCCSVTNILETNYKRNFIAKGYIILNYEDGTSRTIYSNLSDNRSIYYVASNAKSAGYPNMNENEINIIESFLKN